LSNYDDAQHRMPNAPESSAHLTGLLWGLSGGFLTYLHRMNAHIQLSSGAGQTSTSDFYFPDQDQDQFDYHLLTGTLTFTGGVRVVAHHGLLNVAFVAPWLVISDRSVRLSVADERGESLPRIELADVSLPTPTCDGTTLMWSGAQTYLMESGRSLFGDAYPASTSLAPITLRIPWRE